MGVDGGSSTREGSACYVDGDLFYYPLCGEPGVYGTLGMPAPGNLPGGRSSSATWTDRDGNVWLFGGFGFDSSGNLGDLQDLWKFNPTTYQWTWMGGSGALVPCTADTSACSGPAVYGTLGVPAAGNIPVGRDHASNWIDANGNFWLFGGGSLTWPEPENIVTAGGTNDLWEFNPSTNQWALMGGSIQSICGVYCSWSQGAVYGTLGTPAPGINPGTRFAPAGWTDSSGNFWLFGGAGGTGNDLWEYQPSTGALPTTATPVLSLPSGSYTSAQSATISDATNGAFIYYTTDGSTPTVNSTVFFPSGSLPISVQKSETLKAIAVAWGCNPSAVATAAYTVPPPAATPILSLAGATYNTPQTLSISDSTPGATIYYQIYPGYPVNPVYPTTSSPVYNGPITISSTETIWAMATATNYVQSGYAGAFYVINPTAPQTAAPTFSVPSGTYTAPQIVTISDATSGATIYYTTDRSTPTANSTVYANPITVSSSETLQAIAVANGDTNSAIASASYVITPLPTAATPTFSLASGTYTGSQSVTVSDTTPGATIYYTTNGTAPTMSSTTYKGAIMVSASETIEAIAAANGYANSAVASATYTINLAPPTFAFGASPTSLTVYSGSQGSTTLTVTPQNGFNSVVSFACSGLPGSATCSFSPTTVTPSGSLAVATQLTIKVSTQAAVTRPNSRPFVPTIALAVAVCLIGWKKRRRCMQIILLAAVFISLGLISACGGGSGTGGGGGGGGGGPKSYTVTVTATSGSIQQNTAISLTVN